MDNQLDIKELEEHLEKCEKWEEAYPKLIDFVRYAMHETMLPHHFHPQDNNWRSQRVCGAAQRLLNELKEEQLEPKNYTLVHNETYWEDRRHKEPEKLQHAIVRYITFMPMSHFAIICTVSMLLFCAMVKYL